jgi:putative transposase
MQMNCIAFLLLNAFRLNINPWFYQGWVRKALANKNLHVTVVMVWRPHHRQVTRRFFTMKNEVKHTAHSSYRCQYHIVFAPKYRRKVIFKQIRKDIGEILRKLCNEMKVEIIEAEACVDHIHMLVSIPPYMSVAQFVGTLKSKSALMIFDRHANLKYKYGNRHFWCRGYYVDTVGRNEKTIKEYVRNQLQEDIASDQMCLREFKDPFTGEPVVKGK